MAIMHQPLTGTASDNQRGIVLVLLGMAGFAIGDAFIKHLGGTMPLGQIVAVRGVMASIVLWAIVRVRSGGMPWRSLAHPLIALRAACEIGATYCFLSALILMPIANATAILQAIPLTVTFFGSVFLGERVGWRRYTAIMVGLAGIVLIVRPGAEGLEDGALFALATVGFSTARDLVTRRIPKELGSLPVVTVCTFAVTAMGCLWALGEGTVPIGAGDVALLGLAALAMPVGLLCVAAAVRMGELAVVTPFRYSIFLWALVIGWVGFGEVPDALTLVGTAIVLGSGFYTLLREAKLNRDLAARSGKRGAAV